MKLEEKKRRKEDAKDRKFSKTLKYTGILLCRCFYNLSLESSCGGHSHQLGLFQCSFIFAV